MKELLSLCICLSLSVAIASCHGKEQTSADPEQQGQLWLAKARAALRGSDYTLGRAAIDSLRRQCAEALNAREEGILLLDSIDLAEAHVQLEQAEQAALQQGLDIYARDSVDTNLDRAATKVRFYETKLDRDRTNIQKH